MRRSNWYCYIFLVPILLAIASAQDQSCQTPAFFSSNAPRMVNEQAESYIGNLLAQRELTEIRTIEVEELTTPLKAILKRLLATAPPTTLQFQVYLVEAPYANAFTFPGGHIFVTKKALLLAKNEDEIAGLLAHEMGHVLTRQEARDFEELLRKIVDVKSLGTKEDVEERVHQLLENIASSPGTTRDVLMKLASRSNKEQIEADGASIYLLRRSGYNPESFINYFDRLTENKGKVGSSWSEFFHTTKPESKRFREMIKANGTLPSSCKQPSGRMTSEEFSRWRTSLMAYSGFGKVDSVPGGAKHELRDPLRSDISLLRFSPDGKYILAQDLASIYVLSREPFQTLFRFDAALANKAQFTPDSQNIVFVTESSRIEKWSIAERSQVEAIEPHIPRACDQKALSPTGQYLACVQANEKGEFPRQLALLDVETGDPIWVQKDVQRQSFFYFEDYAIPLSVGRHIWLEFSPDGHYLVGSGDGGPFVYDVQAKAALPLTPSLKKLLRASTFLANDRILSYPVNAHEKASIASFPAGEVVGEIPLGELAGARSSNPGFMIVRPYLHSAAALVEISSGKVYLTTKTAPLDIFGNVFVAERADGELGLYDGPNRPPLAMASLTKGPVTGFSAIATSPDGQYIAFSDFRRGGVWQLDDNSRRSLYRGFRGVHIEKSGQMFAVFPPSETYDGPLAVTKDEAKVIGSDAWRREEIKKPGSEIAVINLKTNEAHPVKKFTKQFSVWQQGQFAAVHPRFDENGERPKQLEYDFYDVESGAKLWSRTFNRYGTPSWFFNPVGATLVFGWSAEEKDGEALLKDQKALSLAVDKLPRGRRGIVLLDVLDEHTGKRRFTLPVDTGSGSFSILDVDVVENTLVYTDSYSRLVVYDSSGKRLGRIFGQRAVLDPTGRLLVAQTEPGKLAAYSIPEMKKIQTFTFSGRVVHAGFTADRKQLIVMTADQVVWSVDVSKIAPSTN